MCCTGPTAPAKRTGNVIIQWTACLLHENIARILIGAPPNCRWQPGPTANSPMNGDSPEMSQFDQPGTASSEFVERFGCSTVTFRTLPLAEALAAVAGLGVKVADLGALRGVCEHIDPDGDEHALAAASRIVRASGVRPAALNADPETFDQQSAEIILARVERLAAFCADVGAPVLMLPGGRKDTRPVEGDDELTKLAEGLVASSETCRRHGVQLAVEAPHYLRTIRTFPLTRTLAEKIGNDVPITFDTSHVRASGEDPADSFPVAGPQVAHVQLRDAVPGDMRRVIGEGDIDFARFLKATEAAGYRGCYILELETANSRYATKHEEAAAALDIMARAYAASGRRT